MKITITIHTDGAAFADVNREVARVCRQAADTIESADPINVFGLDFPLYDVNGNKVGDVVGREEESS